jgi:hypothetical protein
MFDKKNFLHPSLFYLFLDPGSGMGKNQDPGSGINIPDPPHWLKQKNSFFLSKIAFYLSVRLYKGRPSKLKEKLSALKREHPASKHDIS